MTKSTRDKLIPLRKALHQYPEVSGQEFETAKRVQQFLLENAKGELVTLTETGFMWVMDSGNAGKTITIRAELDALPIQEVNVFDHASKYEGVSHKCGHDGHATILCGVAVEMMNQPPKNGKYQFLFQPAEENGEGAKAILNSNRYDFYTDYIFALHNLPGFPLGQVMHKCGSFTAAVRSIIVGLTGKTAHAAEPENGISPALAIAEILQLTNELNVNDASRDDFAVIVPVHLNMGELSYGIAAGYGEVHLTLRTWNDAMLNALAAKVVAIVNDVASNHQLKLQIDWAEFFSATDNNPEAVGMVVNVANHLGLVIEQRKMPFKWGEDFGLFTQKFKGAIFGLGAGEDTPALHNPDYDFPDDLIEIGVDMFKEIMQAAQK